MKDSDKILSEALFAKKSPSEKRKEKMPGYSPVGSPGEGVLTGGADNNGIFAVKDKDEMKKRLSKTFGAAFGSNNIRALANKAIKSFPIIVSDNIDADTVLYIKRLVEEQYADYISLLISNKVIDLADYDTAGRDKYGKTIAIQALDDISGADFSKRRMADNAAISGEIDMNDAFSTVPLYNILRETSSMDIKSGNEVLDSLINEGCLIIPANDEKMLKTLLREASSYTSPEIHRETDDAEEVKKKIKDNYKPNELVIKSKVDSSSKAAEEEKDKFIRAVSGHLGYDEDGNAIYRKLMNTSILVDQKHFDEAIDQTVAEFLSSSANSEIRNKFEEASMLLNANMISGGEYIDYVTIRLGLPINKRVRQELVTNFKAEDTVTFDRRIRDVGSTDNKHIYMSNGDADKIASNMKIWGSIRPKIMSAELKSSEKLAKVGIATGAVGGTMAVLSGVGLLNMWNPVGWSILATAGAGTAIASLIYRSKKRRRLERSMSGIEGWERVEMLIDMIEKQRSGVNMKKYSSSDGKSFEVSSVMKDHNKLKGKMQNDTTSSIKSTSRLANPIKDDRREPVEKSEMEKLLRSLREATTADTHDDSNDSEYLIEENLSEMALNDLADSAIDLVNAIDECMDADEEFRAEVLSEALFSKKFGIGTTPTKKIYVDSKPGKSLLMAPEFAATPSYAYGSTEIDAKAVKDRKFNQPLMMTIKFTQRYDDGKYSDNELTAVIGILGKVIRVPSDEMKYILAACAEGEVLNIFGKNGNMTNSIADLLSISKIDKNVKNLPHSAEVWKNLEKVSTLAMSNKISGKKDGVVANAHIVFSEKEIDEVRLETGHDYKRETDLVSQLMKKYSAFNIMIADDASQKLYSYNELDGISWDIVPYREFIGKDSSDALSSALFKIGRMGV